MNAKLRQMLEQIKAAGLAPERERKLRLELEGDGDHAVPGLIPPAAAADSSPIHRLISRVAPRFYDHHDLSTLQALSLSRGSYQMQLSSIDELLERDRLREKDGFPRKVRVGRLVKPGKGGKDKIVLVPTTVEEKLIHDNSFKEQAEEGTAGGSGDGEEGEVIGEQPVRPAEGAGAGPGEGQGGPHELESSAYDLGKILTEQFELPNLKDKGKKRSLTRYTYDLTDKHRGFGQLIDKKATLRKILETNIALGNVPDLHAIDPTKLLVSPHDKIYRVLSQEKDFESQAVVFFLRDYSGSMAGKCTDLVVTQHVLIYSWLLYQYARQVESRFILHDTEAKEVPDFYTYYNSKVAGGTQVSSAYRLVNEIVEKESLEQDYNIYVFHGTDGDDWDTEGKEAVPELKKMLSYANRVGITVAEHSTSGDDKTEVEKYVTASKLLDEQPKLLRLDVIQEDANETRLIAGIKKLISEQMVEV